MAFMINRRTALGGSLALAAFPAAAQDNKRIIVGTWGGDYSRLLAKNIETPLLAPKGWDVVKDEANDPPRRAKMTAEKSLRRGTSDIQGLSAANMYDMNEQGVLEQIDYSKLANAKNLIPAMKYPYGVGHIYSGKVVLYNPKLISTPPTGFADTLDPKNGAKLGIIDIQYQYTMIAAGLASGGSMSNVEPGKERLVECKKAGARIYPSNEALAQALKTEEIALCIMWKARAVQWQNAGINVETVAPKEGVPMYVSGFGMPKNAPSLSRRHANGLGAGGLRRRHGLQPHRHRRQGAARHAKAHRLHRRGEEAPGRPRLWLSVQERFGVPGLVEQVVQGLSAGGWPTPHSCTARSSSGGGAKDGRRRPWSGRRRSSSPSA